MCAFRQPNTTIGCCNKHIFSAIFCGASEFTKSITFGIHQKNTNNSIPQFLAASDKLLFLVEAKSIVDFFTIPPFLASMYLHRTWTGKNTTDCWNEQILIKDIICYRFAMFTSATSFIDSNCFKKFKFTENPTLNKAGRGDFYFYNHCIDSWWYISFGEY